MELVRWIHFASALLWPAGAAIGWWWARSIARPRQRRWLHAIAVVAIVIGAENLLQALAPHHPRTTAHLVGNLALAAAGLAAVFGMVAAGRGIAAEERVLSGGDHVPDKTRPRLVGRGGHRTRLGDLDVADRRQWNGEHPRPYHPHLLCGRRRGRLGLRSRR